MKKSLEKVPVKIFRRNIILRKHFASHSGLYRVIDMKPPMEDTLCNLNPGSERTFLLPWELFSFDQILGGCHVP